MKDTRIKQTEKLPREQREAQVLQLLAVATRPLTLHEIGQGIGLTKCPALRRIVAGLVESGAVEWTWSIVGPNQQQARVFSLEQSWFDELGEEFPVPYEWSQSEPKRTPEEFWSVFSDQDKELIRQTVISLGEK